jgi:hypothetical protein
MSNSTIVKRWMVMVKFGRRKSIPENTGYYDLPWEKEAYRMQDKLAQLVWDADIL